MVVMALIACGWLGVAASGLCTVGFMNMGGGFHWRDLLTLEGFFGTILFLLIFGCVPLVGGVVMLVFTRRVLRNRRARGHM